MSTIELALSHRESGGWKWRVPIQLARNAHRCARPKHYVDELMTLRPRFDVGWHPSGDGTVQAITI